MMILLILFRYDTVSNGNYCHSAKILLFKAMVEYCLECLAAKLCQKDYTCMGIDMI